MIELRDTVPDVNVQPAEYKRLLGYPRDWVLKDRARELAESTRDWYREHGRPWVYAREVDRLDVSGSYVQIGDSSFTSPKLLKTLREAGAHSAVLVAVSAGPELEAEAQARWQDGKPDEYFFLEVYGSSVVEHLMTMTGARLCAWAEGHRTAVLPHYSPGYPEWDISEQPRLLELLNATGAGGKVPVEVLESGMLRPKKSLLAVFGVTRRTERVRRLTELVPCDNCSFASCQYRRVPYRRAPASSSPELGGFVEVLEVLRTDRHPPAPAAALIVDAQYTTNEKALRRWAAERLTLDWKEDGSVEAEFRYDGTTCTNMGRPMEFRYRVTLGPRREGYPIRRQHCGPAPGDEGHTYMCRYMTSSEQLMVAIENERPLLDQPLNDVLSWQRPEASAGCYCEPASRKHKWGLVLETIHYALARAPQRAAAAEETAP
jgi:hypothetical protein